MSRYATLSDPVTNHEDAYFSAVVNTKFCSLGMVVSMTWTATFINVMDGVLRLYDSKESFDADPNDNVLKIRLQHGHYPSPLKQVFINQNADGLTTGGGADFYSFYLMRDYGIMMPIKEIKISCARKETAERLCSVIKSNAN